MILRGGLATAAGAHSMRRAMGQGLARPTLLWMLLVRLLSVVRVELVGVDGTVSVGAAELSVTVGADVDAKVKRHGHLVVVVARVEEAVGAERRGVGGGVGGRPLVLIVGEVIVVQPKRTRRDGKWSFTLKGSIAIAVLIKV